jgi:hypothetical protein
MVQQEYLKQKNLTRICCNQSLLSDQNIIWVMLIGAIEAVLVKEIKKIF